MTWLWIVLYVLAGLATVPFIARSMYDPDDDGIVSGDKNACTFIALGACYAWPLYWVGALFIGLAGLLSPLIFRDKGETGSNG